jgi:hypothetical protein
MLRMMMATAPLAPIGHYIVLSTSVVLFIISFFLFYEGLNYHSAARQTRRVLFGTITLLLYVAIVISVYIIILGRQAAEWHLLESPRTAMIAVLMTRPELLSATFLQAALYPEISAMLRFSGLDYLDAKPANEYEIKRNFSGIVGFTISLALFIVSIVGLAIFIVYGFGNPAAGGSARPTLWH